jgi:DNA polymerase-3 subunit delta'
MSSYPWHQTTLARLQSLRDANQLPNAIALTCAPGWGHEALLKWVSLMLLEDNSDRQVEEFAHPDFRWIVPDGAEIKIDQVRRLNEFAVQTPQSAPRKVAAVLNAHLLNRAAANALLKTLEEPPPNTHLVLATPYWGKLLPTVRSRCQRFTVVQDNALALGWLKENNVTLSDAQFGEFGHAPLTAFDQMTGDSIDLTAWLGTLSPASLSAAVDQIIAGDIVVWLGRWYRRLLMHMSSQPIPNCDLPAAGLFEFADDLVSIRRQIESSNSANARLLLEHLIVRWLQLQRRKAR